MSELDTESSTPWANLPARWIAHRERGARFGSAVVLTVPAGAEYPVHRTRDVERLVYVVDGAGTLGGTGHGDSAETDDSLVLPPGTWHGFTNTGGRPATLLMLFTPATEFPFDAYEVSASGTDGATGELIRWRLHEVPGRPEITTVENGFENFEVNWDGAKGARALVLGFARFGARGTHRWHRHKTADEGGLVLHGRGHSWHDADVPPGVMPGENIVTDGDKIWHPANVWHTLTMSDGDVIDNVWFYLGASTLAETGYELREWVETPLDGRPRIAELGHVGIRCSDVAKQLKFYTEILNLTVTDHDSELGTWFLSSRPDQEHHEVLLASGRDAERDTRLIQQISFRCASLDDVVSFYRSFKKHGVEVDAVVSHGNAIGVYFFDPEGNRCEVYWQTGWSARQPFVEYIDIEISPDQLLAAVQNSVERYGATGYKAPRYVEWATEKGAEAPR